MVLQIKATFVFLVAGILSASSLSLLDTLPKITSSIISKSLGALNILPPISTDGITAFGSNFQTIIDIDNTVESGSLAVIYSSPVTASTYKAIGVLECGLINNGTGINLSALNPFPTIGNITTGGKEPNSDFSGEYVCRASCNATCVVPASDTEADAPASSHPWECKCSATGCDAKGPKTPPNWWLSGTQTVCQKDTSCKCDQVDTDKSVGYTGYLCSWLNVANNGTIIVKVGSVYSPIRWCDCCPN